MIKLYEPATGPFVKVTLSNEETDEKVKVVEEWQRTFDAIPDLVFIVDRDFRVLKVNGMVCDVLQRRREELVGRYCYEILHDRNEPCPNCPQIEASKTKKAESRDIVNPKVGKIYHTTVSPILDEKGEPTRYIHFARDITGQKKMEEALKASEEKYRELINGMNDTAWVIGFDGKFIDVNKAAVKVLGYSREELLRMGPPDIDGSLTKEQIMELINRMPEDKIQVFETTHITKDGRVIPVEISSSLVTYGGKRAILSIARDISERRMAEEKIRQIMEKLHLANEKIMVVGKWARHDARNKLSVIKNSLYLAKKKLPKDHPALKHLEEINAACNQIIEIFNFASAYEMIGVEERSYINVGKIFDEAVALVSGLEGIKIINECHGLEVLADSQLRQLFYNAIENSIRHGGKVSQIRLYYKDEGDTLKLIYEDDGVGISDEIRAHLFREGYGKGTGYGLYLTKKLCEIYGWRIEETGQYGKGAQFTITIPKTDAKGRALYKIHNSPE